MTAVATAPLAEVAMEGAAKTKKICIIDYSGELEKTWATMILASTAATSGIATSVRAVRHIVPMHRRRRRAIAIVRSIRIRRSQSSLR